MPLRRSAASPRPSVRRRSRSPPARHAGSGSCSLRDAPSSPMTTGGIRRCSCAPRLDPTPALLAADRGSSQGRLGARLAHHTRTRTATSAPTRRDVAGPQPAVASRLLPARASTAPRSAQHATHAAYCAPSLHTRTHSARQAPQRNARQAPRQPQAPRRAATQRPPQPAAASHSLPARVPTAPLGAQHATRGAHCAPSASQPTRSNVRQILCFANGPNGSKLIAEFKSSEGHAGTRTKMRRKRNA